jgi:hypothetical protein
MSLLDGEICDRQCDIWERLPVRPKTRMLPFPLSAYFAPQSA